MNQLNIDELIADFRPFHTEFQIEHFIVGTEGPTEWGRYKQALRELEGRTEGVRASVLLLERARLRLGRLIFWSWLPWRRSDRKLNLVEAGDSIKSMELALADTKREQRAFFELARGLKDIIGDLTEEKRARLESDYWFERMRYQAMLELHTTGTLHKSTLETLMTMPRSQELLARVLPESAVKQLVGMERIAI